MRIRFRFIQSAPDLNYHLWNLNLSWKIQPDDKYMTLRDFLHLKPICWLSYDCLFNYAMQTVSRSPILQVVFPTHYQYCISHALSILIDDRQAQHVIIWKQKIVIVNCQVKHFMLSLTEQEKLKHENSCPYGARSNHNRTQNSTNHNISLSVCLSGENFLDLCTWAETCKSFSHRPPL